MSVVATILGGLIGTVASIIALAIFNVGWWSAVAVYFVAGLFSSGTLIWRGMRGTREGAPPVALATWMEELDYHPVAQSDTPAEADSSPSRVA